MTHLTKLGLLTAATLTGVLVGCGPSDPDEGPAPLEVEDARDSGPDSPGIPVTEAGSPTTTPEGGPDTPKGPLVWESVNLQFAPGVPLENGYAWSVSGTGARVFVAMTEHKVANSFSTHGRVLVSDDRGTTWTSSFDGHPSYSLLMGVWATGAKEAFAVGASNYVVATQSYQSAIYRTTDGKAWTPTLRRGGVFEAVWGSGAHIYAVGYTGTSAGAKTAMVDHSTDGGNTWTSVSSPEISKLRDLRGVWGTGPDDVYVSGNGAFTGGAVLRSKDGGQTWVPVLSSNPSSFWSVYGVPASQHLFSAAFDGKIFRSGDSGTTWSWVQLPGIWGGIWGDGDRYYVAGKTAAGALTMQLSMDGGRVWANESLPAGPGTVGSFTSISATSLDVYASGGARTSKPVLLRAAR